MIASFVSQIYQWTRKQGYQDCLQGVRHSGTSLRVDRFQAWAAYWELFLPDVGLAAYRARPQSFESLQTRLASLSEFCTPMHLQKLVEESCLAWLGQETQDELVLGLMGFNRWLQEVYDGSLAASFRQNPLDALRRSAEVLGTEDDWSTATLLTRFGCLLPCSQSSARAFSRFSGQELLSCHQWVTTLQSLGPLSEAVDIDQDFDLLFGQPNPFGLPLLCEVNPLCSSCFLQGECRFFQIKYEEDKKALIEKQLQAGERAAIDARQLVLYLTGEKWQNRSLQNQWIEGFCQGNVLDRIPPSVVSKEDKEFYLFLLALEVAGERLYRSNHNPTGDRVSSAQDIFKHYRYRLGRLKQECFYVSILDNKHHQISLQKISQGILDQTLVHPREVFAPAIHLQAAAVILIHNHPSGDVSPSEQDQSVTKRLVESGTLLGIKVLDHVIISESHYFSFAEQTLMP